MNKDKEILLNEEISNDVYNCEWRYRGSPLDINYKYDEHKPDTYFFSIILNHVFDIDFPVNIDKYLHSLKIYPIEIIEGNVHFVGYLNEEKTKLFLYSKKSDTEYRYSLYSLDIHFIEGFKNSTYYQINVIQETCGYTYDFVMLPKFNNDYDLLRKTYMFDKHNYALHGDTRDTKKKSSLFMQILNLFKR